MRSSIGEQDAPIRPTDVGEEEESEYLEDGWHEGDAVLDSAEALPAHLRLVAEDKQL